MVITHPYMVSYCTALPYSIDWSIRYLTYCEVLLIGCRVGAEHINLLVLHRQDAYWENALTKALTKFEENVAKFRKIQRKTRD